MHIFIFILFSSFEIKELGEKHFDAVDLIETAFNKLADNAVSRKVYLYTKITDTITLSVHLSFTIVN